MTVFTVTVYMQNYTLTSKQSNKHILIVVKCLMEKHVYLVSSSWGGLIPQDTLIDCLYQIADQIEVEEGEIRLYTYGLTYQDVSSKQLCKFVRKEIEGHTVLELHGINGEYIIPCNEINTYLPSRLCEALGFKHTGYNTFTIEVGGSEYNESIKEM